MKKVIIGLGTGRCGTNSLSKLLEYQGIDSTHESVLIPWMKDYTLCDTFIKQLYDRNNDTVADVAFYHLPYVEYYISKIDNIKFICLKRDINQTVKSYMIKTVGRNHWMNDDRFKKDLKWDKCYPTYLDIKDKKLAIKQYWKDYYIESDKLQNLYPNNFKVFNYEEILNIEKEQKLLFDFLEIDKPSVLLNIKLNRSK